MKCFKIIPDKKWFTKYVFWKLW